MRLISLKLQKRYSNHFEDYLPKENTLMTKGIAILCMIILHLFCRKGNDIYGTPLLWLSEGVPFVYVLGFLAEICVPLYSMCSGYAHYVIGEGNRLGIRANMKRIFRFILNYWIIVILFSAVGLALHTPDIPVSFSEFLKNFFLLSTSYNGAWWYVATYVLLCLSSGIIYKAVKKLHWIAVFFIASLQYGIMYICDMFGVFTQVGNGITSFVLRQLDNFFGDVLLCYILGMLLAKLDLFSKVKWFLREYVHINDRLFSVIKIAAVVLASAVVFILEKAIIMPYYALFIFVMFNSSEVKGRVKAVLKFLGKHSTNIWLIHMFFYLCMFPGLVVSARYPVFIFGYMMALCIVVSMGIDFIYQRTKKLIRL